jgi:hypothetical protein
MPETSVQRRDEALPDKSGVSMSSISLSLEAETCPEDVRFVRYSRQLCNIVGSVKSFPVAEDDYFLTLCRYVEANAVRAKLVERAQQWRWCGLWRRVHRSNDLVLSPWPVERPGNWRTLVNAGLSEEELRVVRECVARGRPLGAAHWVLATAARLRLGFTLRGPGRPRKTINN